MRQLYFHLHSRLVSAVLVLLVVLVPVRAGRAIVIDWVGPELGDWNNAANWEDGTIFGVPGSQDPNEAAAINNNTTAALSTTAVSQIAGLILGQTSGNSGGLRITSNGSLVSAAASSETGALSIGASGQGNLTILDNGSLSGTTLSLGGATGSSILLNNSASLSTSGAATLNRTMQVTGPSVNFSAGGNLNLGASGTLIGQITNASLHSPLKSTGIASVNGTFRPEFSGVTPTAGNTWNIIDAATITGNFATLDTSAAPALPSGLGYALQRATGGTNGQLLQLTIEQFLTLQVNRTGGVSIANTGTIPVTFDGYSIISPSGALTGAWNSLEDQGVPGWLEAPPMPNATDLSELHPGAGGLTLNGGQTRALGTPYEQVFPAFGVDPDNVQFEYSTNGQVRTGIVEFSGPKIHNDLILSIDPATGQAQLKNDSPFTISIDSYAVHSDLGSLQPANGDWFSLQDRGISGWDEASPTANAVSELNPDGSLTLTPFSGFDLGELYNSAVGGMVNPDPTLRIEFFLLGEALPSEGVVVFGPFGAVDPPGLAGDFNDDGSVDAADYVVWRKNDGTPAGYSEWQANFGATAAGSGSVASAAQEGGTGVPEPSALGLLMLASLVASAVNFRDFRTVGKTRAG